MRALIEVLRLATVSAVGGGESVNRRCAHFDGVLWELIPQLQTRAQSIDKAAMSRFRPPVDLHEKIFMLLKAARTICHRTLHWICSKGMSQFGGKRFKRDETGRRLRSRAGSRGIPKGRGHLHAREAIPAADRNIVKIRVVKSDERTACACRRRPAYRHVPGVTFGST